MQDNTSIEETVEAPITDQETLEAALNNEPVNAEDTAEQAEETEAPKEKLLGKYESPEALAEAYKSLQSEFTKRNEELKSLREEQKKKEIEGLKTLGYDEQVEYLVNEQMRLKEELEAQKQQYSQVSQEALIEQDKKALEAFIASKPELVETGMDDIFRELATNPLLSQYTFDSIYDSKLKPKLEKLMGTKIRVKERPIKGQSKAPERSFDDVGQMSNAEYEKNRLQILREAGVRI
jgi:hypothetical protein